MLDTCGIEYRWKHSHEFESLVSIWPLLVSDDCSWAGCF